MRAHRRRRHGIERRGKQNHADEQCPDDCNHINRFPPLAEREGPFGDGHLFLVVEASGDDGDVREIHGGSCDAEDAEDGFCGAERDEVEAAAENHDEPDGVEGGVGVRVHAAEDAGRRC